MVIIVVELTGGYISGSLSVFADTTHVGLDFAGALISMMVARRASGHADPHAMRIRWMRVSGFLLLIGLGVIAYEAIERFRHPQDIDAVTVMITTIIAGDFNLEQLRLVPHDHSPTARAQKLHAFGDLITNIAVFIGGFVIWWTGIQWIDPVLSLAVACFVGVLTIRMLMHPSHGGHAH